MEDTQDAQFEKAEEEKKESSSSSEDLKIETGFGQNVIGLNAGSNVLSVDVNQNDSSSEEGDKDKEGPLAVVGVAPEEEEQI